jgi:hypothetical protein
MEQGGVMTACRRTTFWEENSKQLIWVWWAKDHTSGVVWVVFPKMGSLSHLGMNHWRY